MVSQTACKPEPGSLWGENVSDAGVDPPPAMSFCRLIAEEGSKQTRTAVGRPPARLSFGRSVLTVFARLGQRQRPVEPVVAIGIVAQPLGWRWQPARCERAGDGGLTSALRGMPPAGARGDLLARYRAWVAGAVTVTPAHEIDVHVIV